MNESRDLDAPVPGLRPVTASRATLRDAVSFLFKHKWLIGGVSLAVPILATILLYALPRSYSASGSILVEQGKNPTLRVESAEFPSDAVEAIQTEIGILRSREVAERVITRFNLDAKGEPQSSLAQAMASFKESLQSSGLINTMTPMDAAVRSLHRMMKVEQQPLSRVVDVSYSNEDPELAAAVLHGLMDIYLERRREIYGNNTADFFRERVAGVNTRLDAARKRLVRITDNAEVAALELEIRGLERSYLFYTEMLDNALADAAADPSLVNARVVDYPTVPSRPGLARIILILLAAVAGVIMGLGLALLREFFDHRVYAPADLAEQNIPVLGWIGDHRAAVRTV